jgi:tripartite-type tricarboxylate transporter receptor subunit TctC
MKKHVSLVFCLILVLCILVGCSSAANQGSASENPAYPNKPIEILVPANPGGQTDASARVVAEYMKKYLGGDIVVVNQAGGGGAIAFDNVMTAKPDGYKLLYFHQALHTGKATKKMQDDITSLRAIGTFSGVNQAFVVNASSPWTDLKEFVEDAKQRPGQVKFGGQLGGTTHFMGAMLGQEAGIEMQILDIGTESDRMAALLGGQIDMAVTGISNALQYVESGDFKVLAVLAEERDQAAPDYPTAKEQGFDVVFPIVHTLYGPKDLPDDIVEAWNKATEELAKDPAYVEGLAKTGQVHILKNGEEAAQAAQEELERIMQIGAKLGF